MISLLINPILCMVYPKNILTELYPYHPNIYMYSPDKNSHFRVKGEKFRFISSYQQLIKYLNSCEANLKNDIANSVKIPYVNPIAFEKRLYESAIL